MRNLPNESGPTGRVDIHVVELEFGFSYTKRNGTNSTCETWFVLLPKINLWKVLPKKTPLTLRILAVSVIHLHSNIRRRRLKDAYAKRK